MKFDILHETFNELKEVSSSLQRNYPNATIQVWSHYSHMLESMLKPKYIPDIVFINLNYRHEMAGTSVIKHLQMMQLNARFVLFNESEIEDTQRLAELGNIGVLTNPRSSYDYVEIVRLLYMHPKNFIIL